MLGFGVDHTHNWGALPWGCWGLEWTIRTTGGLCPGGAGVWSGPYVQLGGSALGVLGFGVDHTYDWEALPWGAGVWSGPYVRLGGSALGCLGLEWTIRTTGRLCPGVLGFGVDHTYDWEALPWGAGVWSGPYVRLGGSALGCWGLEWTIRTTGGGGGYRVIGRGRG